MRVLAARFPDRNSASAVLGRLEDALRIGAPDLAIAPLGVSDAANGEDTLLAGRVPDERAAEVARLVHEAGGEVLANVDERWTRPRRSGGDHGPAH